jgi:UDP-GlcNAc:undecaprenyl-phosphate GlcNAc-1-phosphate transferase
MTSLPPYITYLSGFIGAFIISLITMPQIIKISSRKKLFDMPDNERKLHMNIVSNLGGAGIFFAYIITSSFFIQPSGFNSWHYILASSVMLFITGIIDDLVALGGVKKIFLQLLPAFFTVYFADLRIHSLYGLFGVQELSHTSSILLSVSGIILLINAFNFIDGADGLAGSIGIFCTVFLGAFLAVTGNVNGACIAFSLAGAIAGFLRYNIHPAKIFMGDSGALPIGYTLSILCLLLVNSSALSSNTIIHSDKNAFLICLAIISVMSLDSFRVLFARAFKGISPFKGDRNHIHHYLLDSGVSNAKTIFILVGVNLCIVITTLMLQDLNTNIVALIIVALTLILFATGYALRKKTKRN